jgi:SAM-dependent methyltransferase
VPRLSSVRESARSVQRNPKEVGAYVLVGLRQVRDDARLIGRGVLYSIAPPPEMGEWEPVGDTPLLRRTYRNKQEYEDQQVAKFPIVKRALAARSHERRAGFVERFGSCPEILAARSVLCLGARTGEEVAALFDHGVLAVGIDLLPGDERYVLRGDWHALEFPDETFEAVYCNAFDHAMDLEAVLKELDRVLAPGGVFLLDIAYGFDEGRAVGPFESLAWPAARALADEVATITGFRLERFGDIRLLHMDGWCEAVYRKP